MKTLLALLLMAVPVMAGPNDAEWNPPAPYDRPYFGMLSVQYLPQDQVVKACRSLMRRGHASNTQRGCARWTKRSCHVIVIDKKFMKQTPQAVLRHEIGHCNGWQHD